MINTLSNFFLLSLLWLLMCLPIVTIFPATASLFAVVRDWKTKSSTHLFSIFFRYFKENFKQSILPGLIWVCLSKNLIVCLRFLLVKTDNHNEIVGLLYFPKTCSCIYHFSHGFRFSKIPCFFLFILTIRYTVDKITDIVVVI
jgi:uncharacterized membrane protein YesL